MRKNVFKKKCLEPREYRAPPGKDYFWGLVAPSVVLVDMQEKFLADLVPNVRERLVLEHQRVLDMCASRNIPVVTLEYADCGPTIDPLREVLKRVRRHRYMDKTGRDGFHRTELRKVLRNTYKTTTVFLMGVYGYQCIWDTAAAAIDHGFVVRTSPAVIADKNCIGGVSDEVSDWFRKEGMFV